MGATHCLELGLMKYYWEQYEDAYGWLAEAWKRLSPLDKSSGITTEDVLQYLIWAEYKVRELGKDKNIKTIVQPPGKGSAMPETFVAQFSQNDTFPCFDSLVLLFF